MPSGVKQAKRVDRTRSVSIFLPPLLSLIVLTALAVAPAIAQEAGTLPTLTIADAAGRPTDAFFASIEPGSTDQVEIRLATGAGTGAPVDTTVSIANVMSAPNGGFALAPDGEALTAPATWIDLDGGPLTLEPGQPVTRTIDIAVPPAADPGQYVAALALTAADPVAIPGIDGVTQTTRATAAIAITVPGEAESGFTLGDPTPVTTATAAFVEIPVENTGTMPIHPQGTLTLESAGETGPVAIPVAMGAVFAGTETVLSVPLATVPPGDYDLTLTLADPDSDASADLEGVSLTVPERAPGAEAASVAFDRIAVDFEGTPLEAVAIEVDVANTGAPIASATLTLEVSRNGLLVDEFAIADDAALADGVTGFATSYSPEGGYTAGLWTFRLRLDSISDDDATTLLAQSGTIAKIDVP